MQPVYATVADLAAWLDIETPPPTAERLLARASELLDVLLVGAVYTVDEHQQPTDPDDADALKRAVCAQVQYTMVTGDETGAMAGISSMTVGSVSITRSTTSGGGSRRATVAERYAPAAVEILQVAGLLPIAPYTY